MNDFEQTTPKELSLASLRLLFAMISVDTQMFTRAKEAISYKGLGRENEVFRFYFDAMLELWEEHRVLPELDILRSKLQADLTEDAMANPNDAAEFGEIIALATSLLALKQSKPDVYVQYVATCNQSFEALIIYAHRLELQDRIASSGGDLSLVLGQGQREVRQALSVSTNRFASPYLEELDNRLEGRFTLTGNRLVDMYTNSTGPATGDIVGHAAPRGSGKSSLVGCIATDVSAAERSHAKADGRPPRFVYIFNYEKVEDPLTHTLSAYAHIPRGTVENFIYTKSLEDFSRGNQYKDYEKKKFAQLIRRAEQKKCPYPPAELERFQRARGKLAENVMIADFTGAKPGFRNMSRQFVEGVAEFISTHQQTIGSPGVEAVFLDYAGTMVRAHMRSLKRVGDATERKLIEDLQFQMKHDVANPMRCFVWIAHQLAAEEASKRPGSRPDPNKFKDCKAFAENCDYTIVSGIPTPKEGMAIFVHSKSRRGEPRPDQIGRLNGEFCRWEPVEIGQEFKIASNQIVSTTDANLIGGEGSFISPDID